MKNKIKYPVFSLAAAVLFFTLAEIVCRVFFVYPGACDFIERRVIEQGLTKYKPNGEFRIFLYGESTMQGDALYPKSTVEKWIAIYLKDLLGQDVAKKVKIYNLARLGSNSHFISQSFLSTIAYKPDLAVFYTSHNDFVQLDNRHSDFDPQPLAFGDKGYLKHLGRRFIRQSAFLSQMNRLYVRFKVERHQRRDRFKKEESLTIETQDKFYNPSYDTINHDSYVFRTIFANWIRNVNRIVHAARRRHVSVIFLEGVSNFKEYEPNESVHHDSLSPSNLAEWEDAHRKAEEAFSHQDYRAALEFYRKCLEIDPEYALTYYRLGQCQENLSEFDKANDYYQTANDKDRVPLRVPSEVNRFYDSVGRANLPDVFIIQTQKLFEKYSANGIADSNLLLDTMHPTIEGQALMALEIVELIYDKGLVAPKEFWHWNDLGPTGDYEKELGLDKDFEFNLYLKKAVFVGRFYDKAIEYSKKALTIKPDSIDAKRQLAWTYWRKGDVDEAMRLYDEIYQKDPDVFEQIMRAQPDLGQSMAFGRKRRNLRIPLVTGSL